MTKLDIGCGYVKRPDAIGIDIRDFSKEYPDGQFRQCDIDNQLLPFEDDSIDGIYAFDILEHCHNLVHVMEEMWRVCKAGSRIEIRVPHENSEWAWGDPTHVRACNQNTFMFFVRGHFINGSDYNFDCDFKVEKMEFTHDNFIQLVYIVVKPKRKTKRWRKYADFNKLNDSGK